MAEGYTPALDQVTLAPMTVKEPSWEDVQLPEDYNALWPRAPGVTGEILPLRRDPFGGLHLAAPGMLHDVVNQGYNALVGPGETLTGRTPTGQPAAPNPYQISLDTVMTGLNLAAPRPGMPGALGTFAGLGARAPDLMARRAAVRAEQIEGKSPEEIFQQTGWFRDKDQNWKFEIPDTAAQLHPDLEKASKVVVSQDIAPIGKATPLSAVMNNPEVYKQYPWTKDILVTSGGKPTGAVYYNNYDGNGMKVIQLGDDTPENIKTTLLHEVQHAIQEHEGFAAGGSPEQFLPPGWHGEKQLLEKNYWEAKKKAQNSGIIDPEDLNALGKAHAQSIMGTASPEQLDMLAFLSKNGDLEHPEIADFLSATADHVNHMKLKLDAAKKYWGLAGEVEARNVEERFNQGVSGDRSVFPWKTEGYPTEPQTVLRGSRVPYQQSFEPVDHNPFPFELTPVEGDPFK